MGIMRSGEGKGEGRGNGLGTYTLPPCLFQRSLARGLAIAVPLLELSQLPCLAVFACFFSCLFPRYPRSLAITPSLYDIAALQRRLLQSGSLGIVRREISGRLVLLLLLLRYATRLGAAFQLEAAADHGRVVVGWHLGGFAERVKKIFMSWSGGGSEAGWAVRMLGCGRISGWVLV